MTKRESTHLAKIRRAAGLSQAAAAEAAGLAPETLCRIEKATARPSEATLQGLADVYGVPLDVLVDAYSKTLKARLKGPIFSS